MSATQLPRRISFRPLTRADLPMLYDWLHRPHVAEWWHDQGDYEEFERDFLPLTVPTSSTRGYMAKLEDQLVGFIQSYVVKGSGEGWWPKETDPGARGIDQFLCNADQLGQGLGRMMIDAFVRQLFEDPAVTKVQTDPSPDNERAIRCYRGAGFTPVEVVDTPDGPALLMIRLR